MFFQSFVEEELDYLHDHKPMSEMINSE